MQMWKSMSPNQQDVDFWPPCSRHSHQGLAVQLSRAEVYAGYQKFDPLCGFQSVQSRRRVCKPSNVIFPGPQHRCDFVSEVALHFPLRVIMEILKSVSPCL